VLNANYLAKKLAPYYEIPHTGGIMHEFVISVKNYKEQYGVTAEDFAKALIDEGYHPPTVYFPLIVDEALMIEPTESESLESLDAFIAALIRIAEKAKSDPASLKKAPVSTPVGRLDQVKAVKDAKVRY